MTAQIDCPEGDLALLDKLSEKESIPREELIRKALAAYLEPSP